MSLLIDGSESLPGASGAGGALERESRLHRNFGLYRQLTYRSQAGFSGYSAEHTLTEPPGGGAAAVYAPVFGCQNDLNAGVLTWPSSVPQHGGGRFQE